MKIKPLNDRVVAKPFGVEEKTKGGIYIPATAQEKTQEAIIVAVGDSPDIKVKVNDKVIHDKYSGTSIKINDDEHIILKAEDILAIIE